MTFASNSGSKLAAADIGSSLTLLTYSSASEKLRSLRSPQSNLFFFENGTEFLKFIETIDQFTFQ